MTPTEQDKELRDAIIGIVEAEYKMPNYIPAAERIEHIMQLITADRKRVALEARLNELTNFMSTLVTTHGNVPARSVSTAKIRQRIAELEAQQEKV